MEYYERITHISFLVVESQGAAGEEADEGEAGPTHRENELVVQVVENNRLKSEGENPHCILVSTYNI